MRIRTVTAIVVVQVVFALALFAVAWTVTSRPSDARVRNLERGLAATQAELRQTRADLATAKSAAAAADRRALIATTRADELQGRVSALEAALRAAGIDPRTVIVVRSSSGPAVTPSSPAPQRTAAPSPRATSTTSPSTAPSPTCRPVPLLGCVRP